MRLVLRLYTMLRMRQTSAETIHSAENATETRTEDMVSKPTYTDCEVENVFLRL